MSPHPSMPELPEVQTVVDEIRPQLMGCSFIGVEVDWAPALATATIPSFQQCLVGQCIMGVRRRGKYIVLSLSSKDTLLIHLMMSGQLSIFPSSKPRDRHVHTRFLLNDGQELRFRDVRKLGRVYLVTNPEEVLGHLGPEPLDEAFTPQQFRVLFTRRRGRLKPLLLNQRFLAGLGNIYTDEVLFSARVHPLRQTDTLNDAQIVRLYQSIQSVLSQAIANRGTTLDDALYRRPDGTPGDYQNRLRVYGRTGEPCISCGTPIQRITVAGRGTHFCPRCQR